MKIGIDAINFYTSSYYLSLAELAESRHIDCHKFWEGLGEYRMSIAPPDEDIVTLGAHAAKRMLDRLKPENIDTLLFATESGIDHSKAAGIYLHRLLKLPQECSVVELKQACYSTTAAIHMAIGLIQSKPDRKVLIVSSDIARYGFNTPGECSQGCGAIALLISKDPRLLVIPPERGFYTEDVMDFWRPVYRQEALVDGKFSCQMYTHALEQSWKHYQKTSGLNFSDHLFHCYHSPIPHLVEKAHRHLAEINQITLSEDEAQKQVQDTLHYCRIIGNCYSASLYVCLASLLDSIADEHVGKRIGFYSYGSGCVGEYFSGILQPEYKQILDTKFHQALVNRRRPVGISVYENWYSLKLPEDGSTHILSSYSPYQEFSFKGIQNHQRLYENLNEKKT